MIAVYRVRQGTRALFAFTHTVDEALAQRYLSPALMGLFRQMRRSEQLHSLNVLRALLAEGDVTASLAIAALLHDVGKTRYPLMLWQRSLPVVVKAASPATMRRLSEQNPPNFLSRGFVVYIHHPEWSGELLEAAGAPADAIWLAVHHADKADVWRDHYLYGDLVRLQQADDTN
jgi:hypothetical protein